MLPLLPIILLGTLPGRHWTKTVFSGDRRAQTYADTLSSLALRAFHILQVLLHDGARQFVSGHALGLDTLGLP